MQDLAAFEQDHPWGTPAEVANLKLHFVSSAGHFGGLPPELYPWVVGFCLCAAEVLGQEHTVGHLVKACAVEAARYDCSPTAYDLH
jgi:hypothetical protein